MKYLYIGTAIQKTLNINSTAADRIFEFVNTPISYVPVIGKAVVINDMTNVN